MNNSLPDEVVNTSTELALALGNPFATEAGFTRKGWYIWGGIPDPDPAHKWQLHTGFMMFEEQGKIMVAAGKREDLLEPLFLCDDFETAKKHVIERCGKINSLH
jgi:hypothetical protein